MNPAAIDKAKRRLAKAEASLAEIQKPQPTYAGFLTHWTDYLLALGGVYTALEHGSKASPTSESWFGQKKSERRDDPLLRYLHQARNADEHGLDPVSVYVPARVSVKRGDPKRVREVNIREGMVSITFEGSADEIEFEVQHSEVRLITIKDKRSRTSYDPPTTHLGKPLANSYLYDVAKIGFEYVRGLVDEAERLKK